MTNAIPQLDNFSKQGSHSSTVNYINPSDTITFAINVKLHRYIATFTYLKCTVLNVNSPHREVFQLRVFRLKHSHNNNTHTTRQSV